MLVAYTVCLSRLEVTTLTGKALELSAILRTSDVLAFSFGDLLSWEGAWLILFAGYVIAIGFVLFQLLTANRTPATTLSWLLFVLLVPYLGLVFYYLLPHRLRLRRLRTRRTRLAGIEDSLVELAPSGGETESTSRFLSKRFFQHLDYDGPVAGNQLELLTSGESFFASLEAAVEEAKEFVHIQTYIFRPDAAGKRVLDLLTATAERGVEVRLLYDSLGSWWLSDKALKGLRRAGGKAHAYLPFFWHKRPLTLNLRNHRKLVVVDGHTSFTGGRNIGVEYATDVQLDGEGNWFDVMVRVRGPVTQQLHRVFVEDWYTAASEDLAVSAYLGPTESVGDSWVVGIENGPDREQRRLRLVLFEMIAHAEHSVLISSPYFIPDLVMTTALIAAAARGARVKLFLNSPQTENAIVYRAGRSYYQRLLEAGIQIVESGPHYNHTKLVIVDGKTLYLGSANFDQRSFVYNFEVGIVSLGDREICAACERMIEERAQEGHAVTLENLKIGRVSLLVDGICRLLSPLL